jgi:hypothetical protein
MGSGAAPVGWPVGVTGKARLPRPFIMRAHGGAVLAGMWRVGFNEERRKKNVFPCCTSRGRRKGNSVVQNDTVLHFFFNMKFKGGASIFFSNYSLIYPLFF